MDRPDSSIVQPGLDVLLADHLDLLAGRRVGLVTSSSAITAQAVPAIDALHPKCQLAALFAPEHGLQAHAADGAAVSSTQDPRTDLPVYSLYGDAKKPTADMLQGIDALLFDIQDVGTRFYTYIWTMSYVLEAAAEYDLPLIILDRPNPIGGQIVEGPPVEPGYESFVGRYSIPLRHSLTIGELAVWLNREHNLNAALTVIPAQGWKRAMWFEQTGLPWAPPSPAMPKPDTAMVYPGACLLEGTNLSCGRGTATPFEAVGAPWIDAYRLADALNNMALPGVRFRPTWFTPCASKHAQQTCQGVFIHVLNRAVFRPLSVGLHLLAAVHALWPDDFAWLKSSWEGHPPHFDLLIGNGWVRPHLDAGQSVSDLEGEWVNYDRQFAADKKQVELYK